MSPINVIAHFDEGRLSESGRFLIDTARRQSRHYAAILKDRHAVLWDRYSGCDDPIRIRTVSTLTFSERAREYGLPYLEPGEKTGRVGKGGCAIPTEEYLQRLVKCYCDRGLSQSWCVPFEIVQKLQKGKINGTTAMNLAGDALREYLVEGKFEVV